MLASCRSSSLGSIAYLPDWLVSEELESGRLRRVLPAWSSAAITAWAVYRAELRGSPRVRAFLEALPGNARELRRKTPPA